MTEQAFRKSEIVKRIESFFIFKVVFLGFKKDPKHFYLPFTFRIFVFFFKVLNMMVTLPIIHNE